MDSDLVWAAERCAAPAAAAVGGCAFDRAHMRVVNTRNGYRMAVHRRRSYTSSEIAISGEVEPHGPANQLRCDALRLRALRLLTTPETRLESNPTRPLRARAAAPA